MLAAALVLHGEALLIAVALIGGFVVLHATGFRSVASLMAAVLSRRRSGESSQPTDGDPPRSWVSYPGLLMRGLFALMLMELVVLGASRLALGIGLGLTALVALTWAPAALYVVATREDLRRRDIALAQVTIVRGLLAQLRPRHVLQAVAIVGLSAGGGVLLVLFLTKGPALITVPLGVAFAVGVVAMYVLGIRAYMRTTVHDRRWHRDWHCEGEDSLDPDGFVRALSEQRTSKGAKHVVERVRAGGLLRPDDTSVELVEELLTTLVTAPTVEVATNGGGAGPATPSANGDDLGRLRVHGGLLVDELGPLLQSLRERRDERAYA